MEWARRVDEGRRSEMTKWRSEGARGREKIP